MFFQLFKFDFMNLRRDGVALTVLATLIAACAFALINGHAVARDREQNLHAFVEDIAQEQAALATPVSPNAIRRTVTLPTGGLTSLSVGRTRLDPWFGVFTYSTRNDRLFSNYQTASPLALQAGAFDLGFVVTVATPLLIIVLGYGIIAAERDSGRLRMVMSYPVRPQRLLAQRLTLRMLLIGVPVTLAAVLGTFSGDAANGAGLGSLALWIAGAWISMLFWWALVGLANTLKVRAETAAMGLVSLWAMLVLVAPALIAAFASALHPPPAQQTLTMEIRAIEVAARDSATDDLKRLMHDHPDLQRQGDAAIAEWQRAAVAQREAMQATLQTPIDVFERKLADQRRVAGFADFLSPALGLSRALSEFSGTGEERHRAFRAQALAYKNGIQTQLAPYMLRTHAMKPDETAALQPFKFVESRPTHALAILAFWAALTAAALFTMFNLAPRTTPL